MDLATHDGVKKQIPHAIPDRMRRGWVRDDRAREGADIIRRCRVRGLRRRSLVQLKATLRPPAAGSGQEGGPACAEFAAGERSVTRVLREVT